ncbi:Transcriptional regulator, MarR [Bacillus cereus BDRD-Cer4]|nr:Transcriptional regulator, MarR [Bacillus cereus BDRD-Cer4]
MNLTIKQNEIKAWRNNAMTRTYKEVINEMNRAYNEFYILLFQELKDEFGLTGQQESMLFHINLNENTTANHIATTFNISKSAVSQVLSKLEKQKMISKQVNPNNKREYFLTLGPNGSKYIERLSELDDVLIEKYFSKIDINALEQMTDTLTKINKVILEEKQKDLDCNE